MVTEEKKPKKNPSMARTAPTVEPNFAKKQAAEEADRLRALGWTESEIDKALGAWR